MKIISKKVLYLSIKEKQNAAKGLERLIEKYCKICLDNNKIRNKYTLQALRHAGLSYMLAGGAQKMQLQTMPV